MVFWNTTQKRYNTKWIINVTVKWLTPWMIIFIKTCDTQGWNMTRWIVWLKDILPNEMMNVLLMNEIWKWVKEKVIQQKIWTLMSNEKQKARKEGRQSKVWDKWWFQFKSALSVGNTYSEFTVQGYITPISLWKPGGQRFNTKRDWDSGCCFDIYEYSTE